MTLAGGAPSGVPTTPLNLVNRAVLDGAGNGRCSLGPNGGGLVWQLTAAAIKTSTSAKVPSCDIYMGRTATPENLIDTTTIGNSNSTSRVAAYPLQSDERIFAVWTGGDPGAEAFLSIFGTERTGPS